MNHAVPNAAFLHGNAAGTATGPARFTPRQLEVLALLCEGLPNKLICRRLNIASGTVKVHISCIFKELGVASRLQAVLTARGLGLHAGTPTQSPGNGRSMREESMDSTVAGTLRSETGLVTVYAPGLPASTPLSASVRTLSR